MREKTVGDLIYRSRVERNITQKQLCDGLCSVQTLSKIESGERIPDVFLLEYLLQRLGISADDFEVVLFDDEFREIELRDTIEDQIVEGNRKEAEMLLERAYKTAREGIRGQYYYLIKAVLSSALNEHMETVEYIKKALACTHINNIKTIKEVLLSTKEIELLCMVAEEYLLLNKDNDARMVLENLLQFIDINDIQEMELVKTYPKIVYLQSQFVNNQKERMESIKRCERAFELLARRASTVFLAEIMQLLIAYYDELKLFNKGLRLKKQLKSMEDLYAEFNRDLYLAQQPMKWFKESKRREYLLCEELIRGERIAKGVKRSSLIEGIYEDIETLVRIENGSQSPSYKAFQMIVRRLNMSIEKYMGLPICDEDEVYETKRRITNYLIKHKFEDAKEDIEKLKILIEEEDFRSRQYIAKEEAYLECQMGQISAEEFRERILAVLNKTYAGSLGEIPRIPTLDESYIFNYLFIAYYRCGEQEESVKLYKRLLNAYGQSKVQKQYHYRSLSILHRNYLVLLEELGYCEEALKLSHMAMQFEMSAARGRGLDYICTEIMCICEKNIKNESKRKKAMERYLRIAFYISDLFLRKTNNTMINEYYRKNIDSEVVWYEN